jgi:hypothetical protein
MRGSIAEWRGPGGNRKVPLSAIRDGVAACSEKRRGHVGETWFPPRDGAAAEAAAEDAAMERSRELAEGEP